MSDEVEQRVYQLLGRPSRSPYGNPIPGLAALDRAAPMIRADGGEHDLARPGLTGAVVVRRICESIQTDNDLLRRLHAAGIDPGAKVSVAQQHGSVVVDRGGEQVRLPQDIAARVFVTTA